MSRGFHIETALEVAINVELTVDIFMNFFQKSVHMYCAYANSTAATTHALATMSICVAGGSN